MYSTKKAHGQHCSFEVRSPNMTSFKYFIISLDVLITDTFFFSAISESINTYFVFVFCLTECVLHGPIVQKITLQLFVKCIEQVPFHDFSSP